MKSNPKFKTLGQYFESRSIYRSLVLPGDSKIVTSYSSSKLKKNVSKGMWVKIRLLLERSFNGLRMAKNMHCLWFNILSGIPWNRFIFFLAIVSLSLLLSALLATTGWTSIRLSIPTCRPLLFSIFLNLAFMFLMKRKSWSGIVWFFSFYFSFISLKSTTVLALRVCDTLLCLKVTLLSSNSRHSDSALSLITSPMEISWDKPYSCCKSFRYFRNLSISFV